MSTAVGDPTLLVLRPPSLPFPSLCTFHFDSDFSAALLCFFCFSFCSPLLFLRPSLTATTTATTPPLFRTHCSTRSFAAVPSIVFIGGPSSLPTLSPSSSPCVRPLSVVVAPLVGIVVCHFSKIHSPSLYIPPRNSFKHDQNDDSINSIRSKCTCTRASTLTNTTAVTILPAGGRARAIAASRYCMRTYACGRGCI